MSNGNIRELDSSLGSNPTKFYGALGANIDATQQASADIDNLWQRSILGDYTVPEQDELRQTTMITNLLRGYMRIAQEEQVAEMKAALEASKNLKELAIG